MIESSKSFKGIDVSRWQGEIDWETAAKEIDFVMIRAAYGRSEDILFRKNMEGAARAGVDTGVYLYSLAATVEEAQDEAAFLLELIRPWKLTYPAALDIEDKRQQPLGRKALTDLVLAYADPIRKAGYLPALYGSLNLLENRFDDRIGQLDLWVAQWSDALTFRGTAGIWQYSNVGRVPGVPVSVNLNISFRNYPSLIRTVGGSWQKDSKGWWYRFTDGSYPAEEWLRLDGRWYRFDQQGYAVTGFRVIDGQPYYFAEASGTEGGHTVKECQCIITDGSGIVQ